MRAFTAIESERLAHHRPEIRYPNHLWRLYSAAEILVSQSMSVFITILAFTRAYELNSEYKYLWMQEYAKLFHVVESINLAEKPYGIERSVAKNRSGRQEKEKEKNWKWYIGFIFSNTASWPT